MKKSLAVLLAVLLSTTTIAFAGNSHDKKMPSPKSEHDLTVGNEKAAGSGSTAEDKTAKDKASKEDKTHTNKGKAKGHDKK